MPPAVEMRNSDLNVGYFVSLDYYAFSQYNADRRNRSCHGN